jgi:hypothetical protein
MTTFMSAYFVLISVLSTLQVTSFSPYNNPMLYETLFWFWKKKDETKFKELTQIFIANKWHQGF